MSLYDPPSDPEYCAHECRNCDQPLTKELDGEWVCHNPKCTHSPFFEPPKRAYCVDCGINDFVDDDWEFVGYDDDTELWRCPNCYDVVSPEEAAEHNKELEDFSRELERKEAKQ